ncbi:MAG: calcium-binding protein [Pseudomonadota bacterium]
MISSSRRIVRINTDETDGFESAFNGQAFIVGSRGSVATDGQSAFELSNAFNSIFNNNLISSANTGATIDISGRLALVRNFNGATISADGGDDANGTAINISGRAAIVNSGLIEADFNGVNFTGVDARGLLNNNRSGVIQSDSRAVNVDGEGVRINNFGTILGTGNQRNGTIYVDDPANNYRIINQFSGTIDAGEGNDGAGISASLSTEEDVSARIVNRGTIEGRGNAGAGGATAGDGIRLETVRDGGALGANTGTFVGSVVNTGDIFSEGANGTVAGFRAVNGVNFQGSLVNGRGGEISGTQNGVYFGTGDHEGGRVVNAGVISSDSRAFNIDGEGLTVINRGRIIGTGDQRNGTVYVDESGNNFSLINRRNGEIDTGEGNLGAGFSAEIAEAGTDFEIVNSGSILGRGNAGAGAATAGDGIRLERTRVDGALDGTTSGIFTGTITNSGLVASEGANGTVAGVRVVNGVSFQGALVNTASGTIEGVQNGVYFGNPVPAGGGDHSGGVLANAGVIASGSRALNIDGDGLTVINSGQIIGTGDQRNGTIYGDETANDFIIINLEDGVVDAGAGNNGSSVSLQVDALINAIVVNEGVFQGQGDSDSANVIGHGLRFNPSENGATFGGAVLNTGVIAGSADSALANGISIEGITAAAVFANFGTVTGLEVAVNASTANGVNFINGGAIDGDVILSSADDIFVLINGGTIDGVVDAGDGSDTLSLSGFTAEEAEALLASDQFAGFETVLVGENAFDFEALQGAIGNEGNSALDNLEVLVTAADAAFGTDNGAIVTSLLDARIDTPAEDFLFG